MPQTIFAPETEVHAVSADRETPMHNHEEVETSSPVIAHYKRIFEITANMRNAAKDEKWDEVLELGKQYDESVVKLRMHPDHSVMSKAEHEARVQLLTGILENDARIRDFVSPELGRVGNMLTQFNKHKTMLQAYAQNMGTLIP